MSVKIQISDTSCTVNTWTIAFVQLLHFLPFYLYLVVMYIIVCKFNNVYMSSILTFYFLPGFTCWKSTRRSACFTGLMWNTFLKIYPCILFTYLTYNTVPLLTMTPVHIEAVTGTGIYDEMKALKDISMTSQVAKLLERIRKEDSWCVTATMSWL